jgi:hypothetical protein
MNAFIFGGSGFRMSVFHFFLSFGIIILNLLTIIFVVLWYCFVGSILVSMKSLLFMKSIIFYS